LCLWCAACVRNVEADFGISLILFGIDVFGVEILGWKAGFLSSVGDLRVGFGVTRLVGTVVGRRRSVMIGRLKQAFVIGYN
jgi:hypothetical protein